MTDEQVWSIQVILIINMCANVYMAAKEWFKR